MKLFDLPKDGGLKEADIHLDILHGYERIYTEIRSDAISASEEIANTIVSLISKHKSKDPIKLGLTTGKTPFALYNALCKRYQEGRVSFNNVEIFSIDEYYPTSPDAAQSRNYRLHKETLDVIDIKPENVHIPDGTINNEEISTYCAKLDEAASKMDLLVIGIGENGQVGFNESGSSMQSRTRVVLLPYGALMFPYMQAVRFFADYLNGDTYYKTKYPEHNLVRTRNQLALFHSGMAHEDEMRKIIDAYGA